MGKAGKEGGFTAFSSAANSERKRIEARHGGKRFNTSIDRVKPEIRLIVSLYLDESSS